MSYPPAITYAIADGSGRAVRLVLNMKCPGCAKMSDADRYGEVVLRCHECGLQILTVSS
jgi:uncharacterized protein (DUF983 family)